MTNFCGKCEGYGHWLDPNTGHKIYCPVCNKKLAKEQDETKNKKYPWTGTILDCKGCLKGCMACFCLKRDEAAEEAKKNMIVGTKKDLLEELRHMSRRLNSIITELEKE